MNNKRTITSVLGAGVAALLIGTAANQYNDGLTSGAEGVRTAPYQDVTGKWTVCRGDTGVPMKIYTLGECNDMLAARLGTYAQHNINVTPGFLKLPDGVKAAATDFSYNLGTGTYDRSDLRQLLIAGNIGAACQQFTRYKFAGRPAKDCSVRSNNCWGVWQRRLDEQALCEGDFTS